MSSRLLIALLLATASFAAAPRPATAATGVSITVNTTADTAASNPAVSAADASGQISLRSAIMFANARANTTETITLPAGTYILSRGTADTFPADADTIGDLDIKDDLIIQGAGRAATHIRGAAAPNEDRVFDIFTANVVLNDLSISNGATPASGVPTHANAGGGIFFRNSPTTGSKVLTLQRCTVSQCQARNGANGGGIALASSFSAPGRNNTLVLDNSAVTSCTAQGSGGGILLAASLARITSSTLTGNRAQSAAPNPFDGGGGIMITGNQSQARITGSDISSNQATATNGGGVYVQSGTANLSFNRIVANLGAVATGLCTNTGAVTAINNWWGCNAGPGASGCSTALSAGAGTIQATPWLLLTLRAVPTSIGPGQTSSLTASLNTNSASATVGGTAPNVVPSTRISSWSGGSLGSIAAGASPFTSAAGTGSATFVAGNSSGNATASVTLDGQTATTAIQIIPQANLSLTSAASSPQIELFNPVTFNLTARNLGPNTATAVTLTDTLPANAGSVAVSLSQGTYSISGGVLTANLGTLASGAVATVSVQVTPNAAGTMTNSASLSSPVADPVSSNNSAISSVAVRARASMLTSLEPTSTSGWTPFGLQIPGRSFSDFDSARQALRGNISADNPGWLRVAGWLSTDSTLLPYSSIGPSRLVRSKFFMYRGGQTTPGAFREIPTLRLRVGHRFAQTSLLEIYTQSDGDPGTTVSREFRPSDDPLRPSVYRVDMDSIDVPKLTELAATEGVAGAFETFSTEAADNGYIAMTEMQLGTYPAAAFPLSQTPAKVYAPTATDAGTLSQSVSEAALISQVLVFGGQPGSPAVAAGPGAGTPSHTEGSFGITLDTRDIVSTAVGVLTREFGAGPFSQRVRIEEDKQYVARFHVTSTQPSSANPVLSLRLRSLRFNWTQRVMIGGAWAASATNNTIAQQMLPGTGCQNPDRNGTENGGWYTVIMTTPLHKEIRAEMDQSLPLSSLMPGILSQPGPGANASSLRDVKVGVDVIDTLSSGANAGLEKGRFTIDRIELRTYNAVLD